MLIAHCDMGNKQGLSLGRDDQCVSIKGNISDGIAKVNNATLLNTRITCYGNLHIAGLFGSDESALVDSRNGFVGACPAENWVCIRRVIILWHKGKGRFSQYPLFLREAKAFNRDIAFD